MNNEYLRLNGKDRQTDKNVVEYSVSASKKKILKSASGENSAINLIIDEINSVEAQENVLLTQAVKKPKLIDAIIFSFASFVIVCLLILLNYFIKDFFLLNLITITFSVILPISVTYFFYRLDVRGNVKFSNIMYYFIAGVTLFIAQNLIFNKGVNQAFQGYYFAVSIKSIIELLLIIVVAWLFIKSKGNVAKSTAFLVVCAVASGFTVAKNLSDNFNSLLINVNFDLGSVGAVINIKELVDKSFNNLISQAMMGSLFNTFMLISLAIIIIDLVCDYNLSKGRKIISLFFTFLLCCSVYVLIMIKPPFDFLLISYKIIATTFTIYLLIKAVNDYVNSEIYI